MSEADFQIPADPQFRVDVLAGLRGPRRAIPARWLYDERGSEMFDEITRLPEYYPTRTETALLEQCREDIAKRIGAGTAVVEFGSGSSTKTPFAAGGDCAVLLYSYRYFGRLSAVIRRCPAIALSIARRDSYRGGFHEARIAACQHRRFVETRLFPGSTIGNFVPRTGVNFLRHVRDILGQGSRLLIGFDRIKPTDVLLPAYDDAAGVTAAFNLNLLHRINRELDGDIPVDAFAHEVRWNDMEARIEMHLRCLRDIRFSVSGEDFAMREGESIHTENSHKYDLRSLRLLLRAGCWTPLADFSDADNWFTLVLAEAAPIYAAP